MRDKSTAMSIDDLAVPAGTYALSDAAGGTQAVAAFRLDRTPVSVAWYRSFVDAGGYDDADLWDDDAWHWRLTHDICAPRFWDDPEPRWAAFGSPDRPLVGVSFFEAQAFCRFVGRRLPTEQEWEAAARGTDARLYPWGDAWEPSRVGHGGKGARCTSPLGSFPGARGPFGHDDLVGNVWQWTSTPFAGVPSAFGPAMVVRGGSWASRDDQCRTDHRNAYGKDGRWSHVGFRTCRSAEG